MSIFDKFRSKKKEPDGESETEKTAVLDEETATQNIIEPAGTSSEEMSLDQAPEAVAAISWEKEDTKPALSLFDRMKKGLAKSRENITGKIESLIKSHKNLDDFFWDEMEEILIQADCGVQVAVGLVEQVKETAQKNKLKESAQVMDILREEIKNLMGSEPAPLHWADQGPTIIMVVGVNGVGKTTSIAKLAHRYKLEGRKVLLVAADTFRAAAIDQLQIWSERAGVEMIKHQEGADPSAVVFDALNALNPRAIDVMIIDTAGRLQNKSNLMSEIGKIRRIIDRERTGAPHEVLLVLDATTGQNAISQAKIFSEVTGVTGIVLTKLDGTAKGGIVLALAKELNIPVKFVGMGESIEDLRDFSPEIFAEALLYKEEEMINSPA